MLIQSIEMQKGFCNILGQPLDSRVQDPVLIGCAVVPHPRQEEAEHFHRLAATVNHAHDAVRHARQSLIEQTRRDGVLLRESIDLQLI